MSFSNRAMLVVLSLAAASGQAARADSNAPAPADQATPAVSASSAEWITVGGSPSGLRSSFDGVVEAVRQTSLSVQVAGAIVELAVKAGDRVQAGQMLMRVDARSAQQGSAASDAQVGAAQAAVDLARKEYERQHQLFAKGYLSQAALDRADSQLKAGEAQLAAQQSLAAAAHTQTGFYVLKAPYSGIISEVPVAQGDMAMPGKPLANLYDPSALRVTVAIPQSALPGLRVPAGVQAEIPGLARGDQMFTPVASRVMPLVDAASHSAELRLDLPPAHAGVSPGMFARAWIPGGAAAGSAPSATSSPRIFVPLSAIVQRAELSGVYAQDGEGHALLRQVRLGPSDAGRVEVLAGLANGDKVLANPRSVDVARVGRR